MYDAHLKISSRLSEENTTTPLVYPENSPCNNNTFRYTHDNDCLNKEVGRQVGDTVLSYKACWRTNLNCFSILASNVSSASTFLGLQRATRTRVFLSLGLHDMVYRITLPGQFVSKLSKVFSVLMHLDPCLEITWISLYPLIDPQPGRDAKFPNYQHINNLITQVNSETNKSVSSAGFRVFNVSAYFPNLSPEMSSDTVHLSKRFDMYLVRELLNISTVGAAISKSKALLENHTIDQSVSSMVSCGERRTQLPGRGEELLVVFFGGSVTSD